MIPRSIRLRFWLGVTGLLVVVGKLDVGGEESGMRHPYMLVTGSPVAGLRSVDAVRRDVKEGRSARLWQELRAKVDKEMKLPLVVAGTKHNRSYRFVATACNRIADSALVALITNERKYALSSLAQIEVLFDPVKWPEWSDQAHLDAGLKSDLRHGQFARAIGFAFDWMCPAADSGRAEENRDGTRSLRDQAFQGFRGGKGEVDLSTVQLEDQCGGRLCHPRQGTGR